MFTQTNFGRYFLFNLISWILKIFMTIFKLHNSELNMQQVLNYFYRNTLYLCESITIYLKYMTKNESIFPITGRQQLLTGILLPDSSLFRVDQ